MIQQTASDKKAPRKFAGKRETEVDEYMVGKEKSVDAVALLVKIAAVALIVVCGAVYLWSGA